MSSLQTFEVHYLFNGEHRAHVFELPQQMLYPHEAALHVMQLHFGDGENSLLMPNAAATPEQILSQAHTLGIEWVPPAANAG